MGTRADFYVGRGPEAEWLGSIAWDGYPIGITPNGMDWPIGEHLFDSEREETFRGRLATFLKNREDVTLPADGWPWPWEDSLTTGYAYAFDVAAGKVYAFCGSWFDPLLPEPEDMDDDTSASFPNMKDRMNVRLDGGSGLIVIWKP